MKSFVSVGLLCALSACATTSTGPVPAGQDTYMISRKEGAFPSGNEPLLAEALAEANKHCAGMGKVMKLISNGENSGPVILGNYPKATVVYSCVIPQ